MLVKLNGGDLARFGLYARSADSVKTCHGMLDGASWNIPDRENLAQTVLSMTLYGHDSTFREMALDVKGRTQAEREEISAVSDAWPAYMWEYTEYVDEKWGDRGIMAWDLFRMSNLVQWGYTAGYVTYEEALALLERGEAPRVPQIYGPQFQYASMLSREMSPLDWAKPAQILVNQVRGLIPWPCASTGVAGVRWKVFRAHVGEETGKVPGTILSAGKNGIAVACGDGRALVITELQADGGRRMAAADYLRGHPVNV